LLEHGLGSATGAASQSAAQASAAARCASAAALGGAPSSKRSPRIASSVHGGGASLRKLQNTCSSAGGLKAWLVKLLSGAARSFVTSKGARQLRLASTNSTRCLPTRSSACSICNW